MEIRGYAVITQFDCDPTRTENASLAEGPVLLETYLEKAGSLAQAKERAAAFRGKYGWALVAFVCADTDSFYNKTEEPR